MPRQPNEPSLLSKPDRETLRAILNYEAANHVAPTHRDLAARLNISKNAVYLRLLELQKAGLISRPAGVATARSIAVNKERLRDELCIEAVANAIRGEANGVPDKLLKEIRGLRTADPKHL